MATIDWEHPRADVWIEQMRQLERAGDPNHVIRRRPATTAGEKTLAGELRRRVDRITVGYQAAIRSVSVERPPTRPGRKACEVCGRRRNLRLARQIWRGSAPINIWRCRGGC